jgi:hypothetical protein
MHDGWCSKILLLENWTPFWNSVNFDDGMCKSTLCLVSKLCIPQFDLNKPLFITTNTKIKKILGL